MHYDPRMADDISTLISKLSGSEADARIAAAEALSNLGTEARGAAVPLCRAVDDEDEQVREAAVAALEELGPPDAQDLAALGTLLTAQGDAAYWAATLIGRLGAQGASAVPQLVKTLAEGTSTAARERAAWALGEIGPAARPALDALRKAAASDSPRLSRLAQTSIGQIGG